MMTARAGDVRKVCWLNTLTGTDSTIYAQTAPRLVRDHPGTEIFTDFRVSHLQLETHD
jgi:hypothetical protein